MRYFPTTSGHDVYDARSPSSVALTPPCATRVTSRHQKRGTAPGAAHHCRFDRNLNFVPTTIREEIEVS